MAQDMQWPSEDEDFDAVTDVHAVKSASTVAEKPAPPPAIETTSAAEAAATPITVASAEPASEVPVESSPEVPAEAAAPEPAPESSETTPPPAVQTTQAGKAGSIGRLILEVALLVALAGVAFWAYGLQQDNKDLKNQVAALNANPQIAIQKQTDELIAKVGKLMDLPTGETPTVANVSDAEAARKQSAFFNSAQNGDKVLMYVKAGQAILYRPSTNKIVLVAPLTFTNSSPPATSSTKTSR